MFRLTLKFHDMKAYRGAEIKIYAVYSLALYGKLRIAWIRGSHSGTAGRFLLVSCLAYPSTLTMEEMCSPETSVNFYRTTWRYNTEVLLLTISFFLRPLLHRLQVNQFPPPPPPIGPVVSEFQRTLIKIT
jgi:hypothetical protein